MVSVDDKVILGIQPNSRGIAFVVFEGAQAPIDWGVKSTRTSNRASLEALNELIEFYGPDVLVLEDAEDDSSLRRPRIKRLLTLCKLAARQHRIQAYAYSRQRVADVFELFEAKTKHEIAAKVGEWLPQFRDAVPPPRKPWTSEARRMAVFDAIALVLVHYYIDG